MTSLLQFARYRVEDGVRDLLGKEISARVSETNLESDLDDAILAGIGAYALRRHLPGDILQGIQVFTAAGSHALLLSNLPMQEFPPTPVSGFGDETELAVTNAIHLGLIRILGCTPFAVRYENDGRLVRNVVPNPAASGTTSSWGADSEFFWHTDNPHQPFGPPGSDPRLYTPPYLTFYAVRNEERVPTEIAALDDVVVRLDEETRLGLTAAEFEIGAPDSNDREATGPLVRTEVLEIGPDGRHRARYDRGTTVGITDAAKRALERWCAVLPTVPSAELVLETGDFMIFDNRRVLHRRKAFTPRPHVRARWLRRCYAA
ncbi:TauD/TfdA family dioxygenase [Streptomyces radiopugnans]|jgi:L-asparagine oxygenase|uniref:Taurine catabolism dioxygenase TauD, TfdA family n=1 Tax=Streptomyces radiopugnans TaxID=403935 RepID=A0A1H9EV98_9ACTN|nr:TauD/TfdA family dioxygenase [Streptomyces radiopugnans]SEQ29650.1 Taurine catabolism dioxygenase TauD, TfdA family [Streptomyces radiopugnans]